MNPNSLFFITLICVYICATGQAQLDSDSSSLTADLQQQFDEETEEFRTVVLDIQRIGYQYLNAPTFDQAFPLLEQFDSKVEEGNAVLKKLIPIAVALFDQKIAGTVKADDELVYFITKVMVRYFDDGQYEQAYELSKKLIENNSDNGYAKVYMARSGLLTNDFSSRVSDILKENLEYFREEETISETEKMLMTNVFHLEELYKHELEIRAQEAVADDLPLVEFETSKGKFVIELFENEAPETVANFISLVEAKHYDGLIFQTVIDQTAAETGIVTEDRGFRDIGYTIYDEFAKPDARLNFAGSVTLNSDKPNTGGSRFFISLAPLPSFNGKQTVFGRIKSGMDTVYRLNKTFKIEEQSQLEIEDVIPDKVISAKVMRKRDKEYKPNTVKPAIR